MSRVRLLHWNANEAANYVELLQAAGYDVKYDHEFRPGMMRLWRESPPDAFVIDLSRRSSRRDEKSRSRCGNHQSCGACTGRILRTERRSCVCNALLRARGSFVAAHPFGSSCACRRGEIVDFVAEKASGAGSDLTERQIREHAIELGLVDYKICSVNEVWSAMLFALKDRRSRHVLYKARGSPEK